MQKQNKKRRMRRSAVLTSASFILLFGLGPGINSSESQSLIPMNHNIAYANDDDDWNYSRSLQDRCDELESKLVDDDDEDNSSESLGEEGADGGVDGDWLTEGSEQYEVALEIFETLTEEYGTSGEFAAGALANVKHESGFIPDRAEGSGELRFGMDSKEAPAGHSGGGGGLFQFTPYSKYTESSYWDQGDEGWEIASQIAAVWGFEFENREVMTYLKSNAQDGARNPNGYDSYSTIEDWLSTDDVIRASWAFQIGYERPAEYHESRESLAKQADRVFNSDNIEANPDNYQLDGSSGGDSDDGGSEDNEIIDGTESPDSDSDRALLEECGIEISEESSGSESAEWGDDGTGEHGESVSSKQYYSRDDLPEDLEGFSIHPDDVGMSWGSRDGWIDAGWSSGGQCTNLSASFLAAIWEKDGSDARSLLDGQTTGNGDRTANVLGGHFGGTTTDEPKKGAVYSVPVGEDGTGEYGHTGIVGHVFENGDVLMVEQNTPHSGDMIDQPLTWNYVLYEASYLDGMNFSYYYPGDDGWSPSGEFDDAGSDDD